MRDHCNGPLIVNARSGSPRRQRCHSQLRPWRRFVWPMNTRPPVGRQRFTWHVCRGSHGSSRPAWLFISGWRSGLRWRAFICSLCAAFSDRRPSGSGRSSASGSHCSCSWHGSSSAAGRTLRGNSSWLPVIWLGLEYFRSELYYLRFAWLTPGFAISHQGWVKLAVLGTYGFSFAVLSLLAVFQTVRRNRPSIAVASLILVLVPVSLGTTPSDGPFIVGIQLEGATESEVLESLEQAIRECTHLDVIVLSEYAFDGEVPINVRNWCSEHQKYLVAGGRGLLDAAASSLIRCLLFLLPAKSSFSRGSRFRFNSSTTASRRASRKSGNRRGEILASRSVTT